MADLQINQAGILLIKDFETLKLTAYRDPDGILTIGYGHTGPDVKSGMVIDEDEAMELLADDLGVAEGGVRRLVQVPLTANQFAALSSFSFNVGVENLKSSTLLKVLNQGYYEQVPSQIVRWIYDKRRVILGGLVRRRKAEAALWNQTDGDNDDTANT